MTALLITIVFSSVLLTLGEKARFDNYRVYSVKVDNEKQLEILQQLENYGDGILFMEAPSVSSRRPTEIVVPPHKFADIGELFEAYYIKNEIKAHNLQKLIDEEAPSYSNRGTYDWNQYYDLESIYKWLNQQIENYPDVLTNLTVGTSYEKRIIRAVKVSHKPGNPTIFIESTIHAREWITVATATYFLNELLHSKDPEIRELADNYDWIIVPVFNVDGYAYTHSKNRLWRKTRKPSSSSCVGTDPNRNFDFHFAEAGTSENPCSETYPGSEPFSEPETLALSKFVQKFADIKLYVGFHSYGQLLLFPYMKIGVKTRDAIKQRYGTNYVVGSVADAIYLAAGSSMDWVYGTQNVSLAYTFEFRGGNGGFVLPPKQIIPNSLEIIDGIKAMIKEAENLRYL